MKTTKKELAARVTKICMTAIASNKNKSSYNEKFNEIAFELQKRYNIPILLSSDILSQKVYAEYQTEYVLFCLLDVMAPDAVSDFFVDKEIKIYSNTKFKVQKIKFPYEIPMIQITDSQWIGKFSAKEFIKLRDAQLIFYNENTQRPLIKKASGGDDEIFIPDVDRKEVEDIMDSYRKETFIPNTITLNMPEDTVYEYKDGKFIIREISNFDITDGYHRYIAMSNIYNLDNEFDYPMELRITQFEEEHAMHFIWQEDQKHKMTKVASDGMNQNLYGNQVVNRLKKLQILKNAINRNNGIIDAALMGRMIDLLYFNKKTKMNNSDILNTAKEIAGKFDDILFEDPYMLDNKWDFRKTIVMMYLIKNSDSIVEDFNKVINIVESEYKDYFSTVSVETKHITRLDKIYKGGDLNV